MRGTSEDYRLPVPRPAKAPAVALPIPDVASLAESGRGLDIIRACVDDLTVRTRPGRGTVVTLRKRITWTADAPLTQLRAAS